MVLQRHDHRGQAVVVFTLADVDYLSSPAGAADLDEVARYPLTDRTRVADVSIIRKRFGCHAGPLVETTLLRRRAAAKFESTDAARWLFTDDSLQQATATPVARHRAARLSGSVVHDATCSVGTELAALRVTAAQVIGSDLDEVRLAMARHNLGPEMALCRADALRPVSRHAVVLLDPGRRSGGRRRTDLRAYTPPLDEVLDVYRDRATVIKCAPGIDFDAVRRLGFDGEIEVTSLGGSVREACLWSPALAASGVRRRATVLDRGEVLTDAEPDDCDVAPPGRWIVDPDGAVVRAGLVRHYANRHGLWQLDPAIAYLTGNLLPEGVRGFEILDQVSVREKVMRQALSAHDCGPLEILVRGVDVDPDRLRRRLRLSGTTPLTLVIARIGSGRSGGAVAFLCRASSGG